MAPRSTSAKTKQSQGTTRGASSDTAAPRDQMTRHDRAAVQDFLDRFATAITSGNTKAVADLWEAPAFVIDDQAAVPVADLNAVELFFEGARDQYNANGITTTKAQILDLDWVSENLVVARVRWPYLDDAGNFLGAESSSYTLKRNSAGDFKLRVILMRGVEEPARPGKHATN